MSHDHLSTGLEKLQDILGKAVTLDAQVRPRPQAQRLMETSTIPTMKDQQEHLDLKIAKPDSFARSPAARSERRKQSREKKEAQEKLFADAQTYLGILNAPARLDWVAPVIICIDVETLEEKPHPITEIGLAVLDVGRIMAADPGPGGCNWWSEIEAHHFRVSEYLYHVNCKYVQGCPEDFDFGTSVVHDGVNVGEALGKMTEQHAADRRDVVLVCHNVAADSKLLRKVGFRTSSLRTLINTVDTQALYMVWAAAEQPRKLEVVLEALGIAYKHLHNAGNDAVYTLRAMIAMAVEGPMPPGQTTRESQLAKKAANLF